MDNRPNMNIKVELKAGCGGMVGFDLQISQLDLQELRQSLQKPEDTRDADLIEEAIQRIILNGIE